MGDNEQRLEDAERFYYGGTPPESYRDEHFGPDEAIGYEAAHPALQAMQWPDGPWGHVSMAAVR